jgi:hypothetical protein
MTRLVRLAVLAGLMAFALPAAAQLAPAEEAAMVHILRDPDRYLVARGPAFSPEERRQAEAAAAARAEAMAAAAAQGERATAVIPGSYTVIPNVTPGFQSNVSFIRFPNFNSDVTTTTTVRIIGDATGIDYGTASVESPPFSSPQLSVTDLYTSIGGVAFDPADTSMTLYLQNNQLLTGVQHVYYNSISDFFENMSVCSYVDGFSYVPMASGVVNVHTSTLQSRFPSVVKVHNRDAVNTVIRLRVHDGPTGNLRGIMQFNAAPNSTYAFSSQQIEAAIGFIPTGNDFHMNVVFDADPMAPPNTIISHTVTNVRVSGSVLNLTTICNIND